MIIKYIGFLFTLLWSYTFIKSQNIFKKGSGILITLFVSNVSWLTFIAACYYGFKNFSFYHAILGIVLSVILEKCSPVIISLLPVAVTIMLALGIASFIFLTSNPSIAA